MTNLTAIITARNEDTCIGTAGSIDADVYLDGVLITSATLAEGFNGTLVAGGPSPDAWLSSPDVLSNEDIDEDPSIVADLIIDAIVDVA